MSKIPASRWLGPPEPAPLGVAYGPWSHDQSIRSVSTVLAYAGDTDEILVRYVGKQRADGTWLEHGGGIRMWRAVESFGSVFIGTDTVRKSAPWPRHMPTVHLDPLVLADSIAALTPR